LAGLDWRSRLGAVAMAVLTEHDRLVGNRYRRAASRIHQLDLSAGDHIPALHPPAGPGARGAEQIAERATGAAEACLEDVGHRTERLEVGRVTAAAQPLVAVAVIGRAALGVRQDLVGLGCLLELRLGVGIVAVDVWMQLARQTAERLLDVGLRCVACDPQHLVVVARGTHRSSYTSVMKLDSCEAASRTERIARP